MTFDSLSNVKNLEASKCVYCLRVNTQVPGQVNSVQVD